MSELETGAGIIHNDDIDFSPPWVVEVPSILLPTTYDTTTTTLDHFPELM